MFLLKEQEWAHFCNSKTKMTHRYSATSPETLVPGAAEWLREVLRENIKLTAKQNSRTPSTAWKGCRYDQWGEERQTVKAKRRGAMSLQQAHWWGCQALAEIQFQTRTLGHLCFCWSVIATVFLAVVFCNLASYHARECCHIQSCTTGCYCGNFAPPKDSVGNSKHHTLRSYLPTCCCLIAFC